MWRATVLVLALALRVAHAEPLIVVRAGDGSPLGLPFSGFSYPVLDDRGHIAFVGSSAVLFSGSGTALVHRVGAGDLVDGRMVAGVGAPALGSSGCLAVRTGFGAGGAGILRQCAGTIEVIAETGLVAPSGRTFAGFASEVAIGAADRVAFTAVLDDRSTALFVADAAGAFTEVVRTGTPSPAGGTFSSLRALGVSASGRVGFRGLTSDGPDGLFVWDGAAVSKLVVVGDASPAGGAFTAIGLGAMNDAETWTFRAGVSGSRTGVFRASMAAPVPAIASVALEGEPTPVGGTFKQFASSLVPAINRAGAIAFRGSVGDGDFSGGVFLARPGSTLTKVVAVGEPTAAGTLVRLREVALADDETVLVRASLTGGTFGLFRAAGDVVEAVAVVGDSTDLGGGFR
ncbi:MAG TPA: choice-of-anchor tandem repeat NxxGxxAF-containing protein, partial [Candidatus Binatus sp.]|nr:choice-of-anchor tandem repeat NxxGxxAF-containing protein [Candidatus Binatus sp.]